MPLPPTTTILVAELGVGGASKVRCPGKSEVDQVLWVDDNCDDMSADDAEVTVHGRTDVGSKTPQTHVTGATNPDAS